MKPRKTWTKKDVSPITNVNEEDPLDFRRKLEQSGNAALVGLVLDMWPIKGHHGEPFLVMLPYGGSYGGREAGMPPIGTPIQAVVYSAPNWGWHLHYWCERLQIFARQTTHQKNMVLENFPWVTEMLLCLGVLSRDNPETARNPA